MAGRSISDITKDDPIGTGLKAGQDSFESIPKEILHALSPAIAQGRRTVLMTCGLSGSGKSTLAKSVVEQFPSFIRLSADSYIFEHHGIYEKDYPDEKYEEYLDEADAALKAQLKEILRTGKSDVVLDRSFWSKEARDEHRDIINREGGGRYQVILVYFQVTEETLWERIQRREKERVQAGVGSDRDPAYKITREVLKRYVSGFEVPSGEGEIVIKVD